LSGDPAFQGYPPALAGRFRQTIKNPPTVGAKELPPRLTAVGVISLSAVVGATPCPFLFYQGEVKWTSSKACTDLLTRIPNGCSVADGIAVCGLAAPKLARSAVGKPSLWSHRDQPDVVNRT
jgi:hypothetical protein